MGHTPIQTGSLGAGGAPWQGMGGASITGLIKIQNKTNVVSKNCFAIQITMKKKGEAQVFVSETKSAESARATRIERMEADQGWK